LASFAGSILGTGSRRAPLDRAFAARGASGDAEGSGAPARRPARRAPRVTALFAVLAGLLVLPSAASAAIVHPLLGFSPITGAGSGVTIHTPAGIAADETTGNVFLQDGTGGNVLAILGAEGGTPVGLLSPFTISPFKFDNEPSGAAVDNSSTSPAKGTLYVADTRNATAANRKVKKFTRNPGTEKYELSGELVPTPATPVEPMGVTVDTKGNVWVAEWAQKAVVKYSPAGTELQRIDTTTTLASGRPSGVAVNAAGDLFVQGYTNPRVVKRWTANGSGEIPPGTVPVEVPETTAATGVAVDTTTNSLYVSFEGKVARYEASTLVKEAEFGEGNLVNARRLVVNSATDRIYISDNGVGRKNVSVYGAIVVPDVTIAAATGVGTTTATVNGTVNPLGAPLTKCVFEYGPTKAYGSTAPCAGTIPADSKPHAVSAALTGLAKNETYHYRLVAATANSVNASSPSVDETFTTNGPPQITAERPLDVDRDSASLRAQVNPSGFATNYHFEWGPTTAYGNRIPVDFDPAIGAGNSPVTVVASLSGLQSGTTYHFRVVASSSSGTTLGADHELTTLNFSNLPNNRQAELVSPANKRPVGAVFQVEAFNSQNYYQAAEDGEAAGYPLIHGIEGSTAGGETIFASQRNPSGWTAEQVTPPILISSVQAESARPAVVLYYDPKDLSCAIISSFNPLTPDTPESDVENGVVNLYRWDKATDTYTLLSNRPPLNPDVLTLSHYQVGGATPDCSRVFFHSVYSFLPGGSKMYEWEDGTLRDAGLRPDDSAAPDAGNGIVGILKNTVSPEGRLFFNGTSNAGKDSGQAAVFVRKGPTEVVNASQSKTANNSLGAAYETASPDGSSVFFLANYGLAATSSNGPVENCTAGSGKPFNNKACDLYRYDVDSEALVDISADTNPSDARGAVVQGVLDVSDDGSVVYFAARGQLIPDQGRTSGQNLVGQGFANIYRWSEDEGLSYVGSLTHENIGMFIPGLVGSAMIHDGEPWVAQTTKTGEYLMFISRDNIDDTNPTNVAQVYLYTASTETLDCVSCPPGGGTPNRPEPQSERTIIAKQPAALGGSTHTPTSLSEDGRAIFSLEEALVPGAIQGTGTNYKENNVYEWHDGQLSLLASGPVKMVGMGGPNGRDVFIQAYDRLSADDVDFTADLYDFRAGGRFAQAPQPPVLCNPGADECQGVPGTPPSAPGSFDSNQTGPGNPALPGGKKCAKGKVLKHGKCVKRPNKKKSKKKAKTQNKRAANNNRGGAK